MEKIGFILKQMEKRIKGKRRQLELILATFLAGGHLLLEDRPGVGKTTIAKTLAEVLGLEFKRIQFTADLLPSDILGVNYFDLNLKEFRFKKGPIFTEILLADEINRASPKTQSGLLEGMEEQQVTIDGKSYRLSPFFFVIATQNPLEESGTFPLPISQLDRFMSALSIGYPDREAERIILLRKGLPPVEKVERTEVERLRQLAREVIVREPIIQLLLNIGEFTRGELFKGGVSTRGLMAILEMAKSWALIRGRDFVIDQDVVDVLPVTLSHRIVPKENNFSVIPTILSAVLK